MSFRDSGFPLEGFGIPLRSEFSGFGIPFGGIRDSLQNAFSGHLGIPFGIRDSFQNLVLDSFVGFGIPPGIPFRTRFPVI